MIYESLVWLALAAIVFLGFFVGAPKWFMYALAVVVGITWAVVKIAARP